MSSARFGRRFGAVVAACALAVVGCATPASGEDRSRKTSAASASPSAQYEKLLVVDCLLPPQMRQLGRLKSYLAPRRLVRVEAGRCADSGGEFSIADRSDVARSIALWMGEAQTGDPKAQTRVGELAEQGQNGVPDFQMAALWYGRAAAQGHAPAQFHLARLYREGQGVTKDAARADELFRLAYGFDGPIAGSVQLVHEAEYAALRTRLDARDGEVAALRAEIERSRTVEAALRAERDGAVAEIAALGGALAKLKQDYADELARRATVVGSTADDVRRLEDERRNHAAREQQLVGRERDLAALREDVHRRIAEAASKEARLEGQARELAQQLAAMKVEREQLDALLAKREAAVAARSTAADELDRRRADLAERLAELTRKEAALAARETAFATATEDARKRERDAQGEAAQVEAALASRKRALDEERAEIDRLRQAAAGSVADYDARRSALTEREAALKSAELAASEARARLAGQEAELARREQALAAAASGASGELAQLRTERDRLAGQLAQAARERGVLDAERAALTASAAQLSAREQDLARELTRLQADQRAMAEREQQVARKEDDLRVREQRVAAELTKIEEVDRKLRELYALRGPASAEAPAAAPVRSRPNVDFGRYHALLIGNANYDRWEKLKSPHRDVDVIGRLLKEQYGFETTILKDATRLEMMTAIKEIGAKVGPDESLLIYYAGHGRLHERLEQVAYWAGVDSGDKDYESMVSIHDLQQRLSVLEARQIMVIADSCYAGAMARGPVSLLNDKASPQEWETYLRRVVERSGRWFISSGGVAPAEDGGGFDGHSVFASAVVQALSANRDVLPGENFFSEVTNWVERTTLRIKGDIQKPTYAAAHFMGPHEGGEFLFVPSELQAADASSGRERQLAQVDAAAARSGDRR